jgi:hypothetical protein
MLEDAKQQASARFVDQIGRTTDGLGHASEALRTVGDELRQRDEEFIAGYADGAADQIERAAVYLDGKDFDHLVGDVERFARRQPALFLAGAFGLGILAARFLKSSPTPGNGVSSHHYVSGTGTYDRPTRTSAPSMSKVRPDASVSVPRRQAPSPTPVPQNRIARSQPTQSWHAPSSRTVRDPFNSEESW